MAAAHAADAARRAGRAASPLAGLPISVKDLFDIAGEVTRAGSRVREGAAPATTTAPAIARLFAAGLISTGRTNMTEFAFSGLGINPHYGTPRSPYEREAGNPLGGRIPGGSSSGAAVSVSDGMALAGIGTDTGGSCRIPAACCGIVGFKPTAKRVPRAGAFPLSPTLDSVGPLARVVADCEWLDALMAGEAHAPLETPDLSSLRILLAQDFVLDGMDVPTESSLDRAVRKLARAGVRFVTAELGSFLGVIEANRSGGFAAPEAYAIHAKTLASDEARYDPRIAARIRKGAAMRAADYAALFWQRARLSAQFEGELAGFDAVLLPTIPVRPPRIAELDADDDAYLRANALLLRNPSLINVLDGCAISLPCQEPGAPPAGLMLAAPGGQDHRLFAVARALEAALAG